MSLRIGLCARVNTPESSGSAEIRADLLKTGPYNYDRWFTAAFGVNEVRLSRVSLA